jgi:hypothetical protein
MEWSLNAAKRPVPAGALLPNSCVKRTANEKTIDLAIQISMVSDELQGILKPSVQ